MITLQEEWKEYRDKVYPKGIPADQSRECHQAFMAGAFIALTVIDALANTLPEDEAAKRTAEIFREAQEWCRLRIEALNQPRN